MMLRVNMNYWIIAGCLGLLNTCLNVSVYAQGPVKQTGTAPSTLQTNSDVFAGDTRLSQKAALHVEGIPLDDLLSQLSRQTGVTLKVQQDIADEKVIVFSSARPLRDLLNDVAALRNDTWMRQEQEGSKPTYRLVRNGRARELENDLLAKMNNRLELRLEEQVRALAETPDERNHRPENDPIRRRLSDPHGHMETRFYALLNPAQCQFLFAHDYFDVPYTVMNPAQQEALRNAFVEINSGTGIVDPNGVKATGVPDDLENSALRFSLSYQGGRQSLGFGFDPPGYGLDGVDIATIDNRIEWLLPPHGNPYTGAPVSARAILPAAAAVYSVWSGRTELKSYGPKKIWLERLATLAEQTGLTICADFYRSKAAHQFAVEPPSSEAPAVPAVRDSITELDNLCRPFGYLWWMRGKTLLLRKRDWFEQRQYEVPDRWMLDMVKRLQTQKGVPSYGDATRLLDLTTEQIAGLMSFNDTPNGERYGDLGIMRRTALGSRELLALWNSLTNSASDALPGREKLTDVETYVKRYEQTTRSYNEFTEPQRGLAVSFVNGDYVFGMGVPRRRRPVTEPEMTAFRTRISSTVSTLPPASAVPPTSEKEPKVSAHVFHAVPLELTWWMQGGSGTNQCLLFLPLELPLDRRDKTKIEITP